MSLADRQRVERAVRVGDVALPALDVSVPDSEPRRPILMPSPSASHVARLAHDAVVELLAARRRPFQQLHGAVDGNGFFVAGDQKRDRAVQFAAVGRKIVEHGGDESGDAALHVDRAAAVEQTVRRLAGERRQRPSRLVARRHHVGMAGEHQVRAAGADARIEIVDVGRAGLGEGDAMTAKPASPSSRSSTPSAPASAGVTEGSGRGRGQWKGRLSWHPLNMSKTGGASEFAVMPQGRDRDYDPSGSSPCAFGPTVPRIRPSSMKYQSAMPVPASRNR